MNWICVVAFVSIERVSTSDDKKQNLIGHVREALTGLTRSMLLQVVPISRVHRGFSAGSAGNVGMKDS